LAKIEKKIVAVFYRTARGRQPVREWLLALSDDDRREIGKDIQRIEFEWPVGMPHCRSIESELWEVRSSISDGRVARVLFSVDEGELFLLHGFIKKTRKTLEGDSALARKRLKEGRVKARHRGQEFSEFLDELGIREDVESQAIKEILADQVLAAMKEEKLSKTAMAARMETSRRALDRLLDPRNTSVTLRTMQKAAHAVGRRIQLELV